MTPATEAEHALRDPADAEAYALEVEREADAVALAEAEAHDAALYDQLRTEAALYDEAGYLPELDP